MFVQDDDDDVYGVISDRLVLRPAILRAVAALSRAAKRPRLSSDAGDMSGRDGASGRHSRDERDGRDDEDDGDRVEDSAEAYGSGSRGSGQGGRGSESMRSPDVNSILNEVRRDRRLRQVPPTRIRLCAERMVEDSIMYHSGGGSGEAGSVAYGIV